MSTTSPARWSPADATRTLVCERCGAAFGCTNTGEVGSCWCSEEAFRLPFGALPEADCLCPDCLRKAADELKARGLGPA
jgi:hypothetical protein